MLSERHSLNLKLCGKQWLVTTTQPNQGRRAVPMSSLCVYGVTVAGNIELKLSVNNVNTALLYSSRKLHHKCLWQKDLTLGLTTHKLKLIRWNLGRVFNSKRGCKNTKYILCVLLAVRPNLHLKTRPKQLSSYPLIYIALPGLTR